MDDYTEIARFDCGEYFNCIIRRIEQLDLYNTDKFSVEMIISGSCTVSMEGITFTAKADDIFSVRGNLCRSYSGNGCTAVSVEFDQTFFERILPEPRRPEFLCNSALYGSSPSYEELKRTLAQIIKNNADARPGYELGNFSLLYTIMDIMYLNFKVDGSESKNRSIHRYASRVAEITRIINENYMQDLTLTDLASAVHLSSPYLSRFFEKQFGRTFIKYLTDVRLKHATEELLFTNNTIEAISANAGFPNSYSFVQSFKKEKGVLPSIYRRKARQESENSVVSQPVEQTDFLSGLSKYLNSSAEAGSTPTTACYIMADAGENLGTLQHSWRTLTGISRASFLLMEDVRDVIRRVQHEIGFRYIKFNGIFSDDMHVYEENRDGRPVFSFGYVDKALDFLLSVSLKPMIQLGFMPKLLAGNPRKIFGYQVSEPASISIWCGMTSALISHLIDRYGTEEVRSWKFSLWHQPDTPGNMYGFGSDELFFRFWLATFNAVKKCDSSIQFGMPATFYILKKDYVNWYIPFLTWCREHDCVPDFLNFNYYDVTLLGTESGSQPFGFTHPMELSDTGSSFRDFIAQLRSERKKLDCMKMPAYLSEWNTSPSQEDLLNDTSYKSCYIVKCILENYDRLDSFTYWSLTDLMGEAPQPKEMFSGGLGMFTAGGIPKASYYAFTLLRRLGDTMVGHGEGWFLTRQKNEFQLMIYHYRHFSKLYAKGERFDMTFTNRYTPFEPEQIMDVHLTLRGIPDGKYIITETYVGRKSGSAFDEWVAMGAVEFNEQYELDTLASLSVPRINKYVLAAENRQLHLDSMLDLLDVKLIRIALLNPTS